MKRIITASTEKALSLVAAKSHLRIYHNELDTLIESYVSMAVDMFEGETGMILLESTVEQIIPTGETELIIKTKPFVSLTSVIVNGVTLVDGTDYELHDEMPYRLELEDTHSYPAYVRYKAGYAEAELIPADIQGALKLIVGRIYTHPEDPIDKGISIASRITRKYRSYDR